MKLFESLWRDEAGYILSAEAALLGTVGVVGATVGLGAVSKSVNDELKEVAYAFRSLDQSYCIEGQVGCGACTAPSCFTQQSAEESRAELGEWIAEQEELEELEQTDDAAPATTPRQEKDRKRMMERRRELEERREEMKKKQDAKKKKRKKQQS